MKENSLSDVYDELAGACALNEVMLGPNNGLSGWLQLSYSLPDEKAVTIHVREDDKGVCWLYKPGYDAEEALDENTSLVDLFAETIHAVEDAWKKAGYPLLSTMAIDLKKYLHLIGEDHRIFVQEHVWGGYKLVVYLPKVDADDHDKIFVDFSTDDKVYTFNAPWVNGKEYEKTSNYRFLLESLVGIVNERVSTLKFIDRIKAITQETKGERLLERYNPDGLIRRIKELSKLSDKVTILNKDALDIIRDYSGLDKATFLIDPPYIDKGHQLYRLSYPDLNQHQELFSLLESLHNNGAKADYIVYYDDSEAFSQLDCLPENQEVVARNYSITHNKKD